MFACACAMHWSMKYFIFIGRIPIGLMCLVAFKCVYLLRWVGPHPDWEMGGWLSVFCFPIIVNHFVSLLYQSLIISFLFLIGLLLHAEYQLHPPICATSSIRLIGSIVHHQGQDTPDMVKLHFWVVGVYIFPYLRQFFIKFSAT